MMNGNNNIIDIVETLVSQMTPFVTVSSVEASGSNWKLNTSNTFWITPLSNIVIDSVNYQVISFEQDSYIVISADVEPTVTEFQLEAPEFWHSSSRKVSGERSQKTDIRKPFVYLPVPRTTEDKVYDSDKAYDAAIRPIFLTNFDVQNDTISEQQTEIIGPLNAMSQFFIYLIELDTANFEDLDTVDTREWMNFGDETVWGNDKKIFKENLSGVELNFNLPVLINVNACGDTPVVTCAPVAIVADDIFIENVPSGGTYSYSTACQDGAVTVNSDAFGNVLSGGTIDVPVQYVNGTPVGTINAGVVEVPNPIELVRIYNPPGYTGAGDRGQLYDTYWRMLNNIGNYSQPMTGVAMRLAWGKYYMLHPDITIGNVFGNSQRWTGTTGGYFDWDTWYSSGKVTLNYYDVDDVATTRGLAFPDGLAVDHWIGGLVETDPANAVDVWVDWLTLGQTKTIGAFTEFYLMSVPEIVAFGTWGDITLPYTDSPLFQWNAGLKLTADSYPASGTSNAMVVQAYGHITSTAKGNNNRAIYYKPIDINTIFG